MRIVIPFNEKNFTRDCLLHFRLRYKRNTRDLISISILSTGLLLLGYLTNSYDNHINPLNFSGWVFAAMVAYFVLFRASARKKYISAVRSHIEKRKSNPLDCVFEMDDQSFRYSDPEKKLEFVWNVFSHFAILEDQIVLSVDPVYQTVFFLHKSEVDEQTFNEARTFIASKVPQKEISWL